MSNFSLDGFRNGLLADGIAMPDGDENRLSPALTLRIPAEHWERAAIRCKNAGMRWAALWVKEQASGFEVFSGLEKNGNYLILTAKLADRQPLISLAHIFPAADRPQRHAQDLLGIEFEGQYDNRRWVRHQAWTGREFPLRRDWQPREFSAPTEPDDSYPFHRASGSGTYEIPVGPVHAGIIEPGHFRFQAVGETVLNLEIRLGYVHKGIEKLAVGRDLPGLVRLAGRVSGDSTVAHAWAACMAVERALRISLPPRAQLLRGIMAERERVANHLGDIGSICNDVGFSFPFYQLTRLKEEWVRESAGLFGHRFMMDCLVPGGVATDLSPKDTAQARIHAGELEREVAAIIETIERSESLEDRLMTTGRLTPQWAAKLGTVGYVGRASGMDYDLRRDAPYGPYQSVETRVIGYHAGDVAARAKVRSEEITVSLGLIRRFIELLEPGEIKAPVPEGRGGEGLGIVEGWRGEIITYVSLDQSGRVERFFPRDPSWLLWPALEQLIQDNIVPDFPVCNKSVNGSYSGQDL